MCTAINRKKINKINIVFETIRLAICEDIRFLICKQCHKTKPDYNSVQTYHQMSMADGEP